MSRRNRLPEPQEVSIESMSHEGRGIAHVNGKTVFVFGALEQERVRIQVQKRRRKFDQATTLEVLEASPRRIERSHFLLSHLLHGATALSHARRT